MKKGAFGFGRAFFCGFVLRGLSGLCNFAYATAILTLTMKKMLALVAAAATVAAGWCADGPALRMLRADGRTDTVSTARYYLIGITEPGATALVDGSDCHVYRTGCFGTELTLAPGENTAKVAVAKDGATTGRTVKIFYDPDRRRPAENAVAPLVELPGPLAVVSKAGAYLQHGNAADRLGGSKMNFIPEGIEFVAVAANDRLYRVMLGQNDWAYLPREYADEAGEAPQAYDRAVTTGSISVANVGRTDRIVVALPKRLPYYTRTEIDPSTILITLYGATDNSNWLTQRSTPAMIDFVDLRREGPDKLTLVVRLREEYSWGYTVGYDGTNLTVDVRHRPASLALSDLTIGLDAGHGGEYPGARSPSGLTEKEVNLDIVLKAAEMLRSRGARVVLTREGDTGPSMAERKRIWLEGGVDLAVSVHNNSSGNPLVPMGTSAYYKHIANRALAASLHRAMLSMGLEDFGLTGNFNFSLNGPTDYPNALVEVLFMSSLPEEELLADPDYRTELARHIVEGICDYLRQVEESIQ